MGCADQGERRIGRLTRFETAAQICLGESFTMIGVDARNDKLTCPIAKKAKGIAIQSPDRRARAALAGCRDRALWWS